MKRFMQLLLILFLLSVFVGCGDGKEKESSSATVKGKNKSDRSELLVSAAISLTDALNEIAKIYETDNNVNITFNFAGSGKLAQQIQQGAPVDVFISANERWMNTLIDKGFIDKNTQKDVTGNKLVLIAAKESPINYDSFIEIELNDVKQIAIGNPESVPAGKYAETILRNIKKWDELDGTYVFAQDVRQVLTYVETGNAEIGFVYESDALNSDKVEILA